MPLVTASLYLLSKVINSIGGYSIAGRASALEEMRSPPQLLYKHSLIYLTRRVIAAVKSVNETLPIKKSEISNRT